MSAPSPAEAASPAATKRTPARTASDAAPAPAPAPDTTPAPPRKRKRRRPAPDGAAAPGLAHSATLRHAAYAYLHLELVAAGSVGLGSGGGGDSSGAASPADSDGAAGAADALALLGALRAPLRAHLGVHGASIPLDVLHARGSGGGGSGRGAVLAHAHVRTPRASARHVEAALAAWAGWVDGDAVAGGAHGGGGEGDAEFHAGGKVRAMWKIRGSAAWLGCCTACPLRTDGGGRGGASVWDD